MSFWAGFSSGLGSSLLQVSQQVAQQRQQKDLAIAKTISAAASGGDTATLEALKKAGEGIYGKDAFGALVQTAQAIQRGNQQFLEQGGFAPPSEGPQAAPVPAPQVQEAPTTQDAPASVPAPAPQQRMQLAPGARVSRKIGGATYSVSGQPLGDLGPEVNTILREFYNVDAANASQEQVAVANHAARIRRVQQLGSEAAARTNAQIQAQAANVGNLGVVSGAQAGGAESARLQAQAANLPAIGAAEGTRAAARGQAAPLPPQTTGEANVPLGTTVGEARQGGITLTPQELRDIEATSGTILGTHIKALEETIPKLLSVAKSTDDPFSMEGAKVGADLARQYARNSGRFRLGNKDAVRFQGAASNILSLVSRLSGERGVLTEQDVARVRALMPTFGTPRETAIAQVKEIRNLIQTRVNEYRQQYNRAPVGGGAPAAPTYQNTLERARQLQQGQ